MEVVGKINGILEIYGLRDVSCELILLTPKLNQVIRIKENV